LRSISCENQTVYEINIKLLEKILIFLTKKDIELIICHNNYIKKLNSQFRQIDKTTDVLSFPLEDVPFSSLGSIVINVDMVMQKSKELNHSFDDELALLFIHGLLHLLGFDHEKDNGEHREEEKKLINQFALPKSLIIRTNKGTI
jgi:probable rRNA maturation factor